MKLIPYQQQQDIFTSRFLYSSIFSSVYRCHPYSYCPVGKIAQKSVWRSTFLLIRHSKYSASSSFY